MDKLTMAHEMAVAMQSAEPMTDMNLLASLCFQYADAMQAEAKKREDTSRPDVLNMADSPQLNWQPDWSQAPEWANYWMLAPNGCANWLSNHPSRLIAKALPAPYFDYTGSWRDSLRKRP